MGGFRKAKESEVETIQALGDMLSSFQARGFRAKICPRRTRK